MNVRYDVVVIGAGPAGSVAAHRAARAGMSVLLLDRARFPRHKVCGCCLNARALASLRGAGLTDVADAVGARVLERLDVHAPGRSASLRLAGSRSVSRHRLDAALAEHAQRAGAVFVDGVSATMGRLVGESRRIDLLDHSGRTDEVYAAVVVIADGLAGTALRHHPELDARVRARSRIGAAAIVESPPRGYPDGVVTLAGAQSGYVGTVRLEDGRLNVAAALDPGAVRERGSLAALAAEILAATGLPRIPALAAATWKGTPALTRRCPALAGERFFVIGDAAGYVEPFTGEGMAWAVEAAVASGSWIEAGACGWRSELARGWKRRQRRRLRRRQWGCRAVAAVLRRPLVTAAAIDCIRRSPRLAAPLVRHLTQPSHG